MTTDPEETFERDAVRSLLAREIGGDAASARVGLRLLHGGLESPVALVTARYRDAELRRRTARFVIKRLEGTRRREAHAFARAHAHDAAIAPRFVGVTDGSAGAAYLGMEYVRSAAVWPWSAVDASHALLRQLAILHAAPVEAEAADAEYELELQSSAEETLREVEAIDDPELRPLRRALRAMRAVVRELPAMRSVLMTSPLGVAVIHGDAHTGNVVLRRESGAAPTFIDWGRSRLGSPLEDVSSWIESLGFWEPETRRNLEPLFSGYLGARGRDRTITPELRLAYAIAAASNVLAGAIRYHLWCASAASEGSDARRRAIEAAHDALRLVRIAHALWRKRGR